MNKRDNPYTPGAGRKPRTLAGRDHDLESFQSLVERLDAGTYERSLGSPPGRIDALIKKVFSQVKAETGKIDHAPVCANTRYFSWRVARNGRNKPVARCCTSGIHGVESPCLGAQDPDVFAVAFSRAN